ncbi:EAL domain-containing protein [Ornithinibacillus salinisoli]|uniref:EAL domain-containing protein n=1 Tax=Ornithinibacillus salinisoli TaxID=1848459 RepID=A0ABW4W1E3_9BACI
MKLKAKTLLVLWVTTAVFIALIYIVFRPIMLEDSIELDRSSALKNLERINNILIGQMESLNRTNRDWSVWDDTYLFIKHEYPAYPDVNLQGDTFENNILNFMIYLDRNNEVVDQRGYDLEKRINVDLDPNFHSNFLPLFQSSNQIDDTFLISTSYGLTMTSLQSVYKSSGDGPSAGTLIMGRFINQRSITKIGERLSLSLSLNQLDSGVDQAGPIVDNISESELKGSLFLEDHLEEAIYEISYTDEREFYLQKKEDISRLLGYLIIIGMVLTFLVIFFLNRFILTRVEKLSLQLNKIQQSKNLQTRVSLGNGSKDEITALSYSINEMLSSLEDKQNEITKLAYSDQLTLLPNRYLFRKEFERYKKEGQEKMSLLFFDINDFKRVNDLLGHNIGDSLIKEVSGRVLPIIKEQDGLLARYGGDEFVILIINKDMATIRTIIETILHEVDKEYRVGPFKTFATVSIGVSNYPQDGETLEELLQKADIAMYEAKKSGRNQYIYYEDLTSASSYRDLLELENDLNFALQNKEFELYYQPIYSGSEREMVGVEALLRWNHPTNGQISPTRFVPVAEEMGLMPSIGLWILEAAIDQANKWYQKGLIGFVSINISKTQMKDSSFIDKLDQLIKKYPFMPPMIHFEITESDITHYVREVVAFAKELKKRKVKIALDDFGVGTSSLLYLKELPIDVIKIDRNFIKNVPEDHYDSVLLAGILKITKELNLEVIIEGIESPEQIEYITSRSDAKLQGYYFSKPKPAYELEKTLRLE